mgnify:CR=1 FL=1
MSITVSVSMQVADFDDWKAVFDARENDRAEAGIHAKAYRNIDDTNIAIGVVTAPTKEIVMAFFSRPKNARDYEKRGCTCPP